MGQVLTRETQHDENAGDNDAGGLYRSRSARSFADITVGTFRRNLRRVRHFFSRKSRHRTENRPENIELSPMSESQSEKSEIEVAFESQSLEETPKIVETNENNGVIKLYPHLSTGQEKIKGSESLENQEEFELKPVKKPEYLDFPFLEDQNTINWIRQNRTVFLMRGLPGSGKSFLVNALTEMYNDLNPVICSADSYFYDDHGIYRYNSGRIQDAHEHSQTMFQNALKEGKKIVIVDNTNVLAFEMRPYFIQSTKSPFTYRVIVVEPKTPWRFVPSQLAEKNSHNVPVETIHKRIKKYVQALPIYFGWFLSPTDSKILLDKSQEMFKKMYECEIFRHNFGQFSAMLNLKSALNYYSREMMTTGDRTILHCTAKFIGFSKKPDLSETMKNYMSKNQLQESLGQVQKLKIIGYYLTKETFGCRIELNEDQLELYEQDEKSTTQNRQYGKPFKPFPNEDEVIEENATIEEIEQNCDINRFCPLTEYGKRAHITLFTARNARAVNAGIDLLSIVQAEQKGEVVKEFVIPGTQDVMRLYKDNLWVLYPEKALQVDSLFTGFY